MRAAINRLVAGSNPAWGYRPGPETTPTAHEVFCLGWPAQQRRARPDRGVAANREWRVLELRRLGL